eukprot:CAMPEP_0183302694 /NCGR_PEP_ID=MMETSP0160_2-20130417/8384_1 /TAXON_ID=2839 ORGANISM="Odontella Sinensis, Strain Grunow 1884" /NCGR_SAMPLE_ID=MMETSP0160_2 /ASSEMBLY_ACC=CAM_ASM_000250 /LENGTH=102 /DNA_ID=CAMNT_0025465497 /DNA_START=152 /DNA_END=460 /DNA_ORIENTATION=-
MTAEEEAKQLDSVTDVVQEKEFDASKAQQAMTALSAAPPAGSKGGGAAGKKAVSVSKEDVAVIVAELEVTEDVAEKALREASAEAGEGKSPLEAALRQLIAA